MTGLFAAIRQDRPFAIAAEFGCESGEIIALVGPSGSGKSTILRAISGTQKGIRGRIIVGGETWLDTEAARSLPAHRRAAGFVFQSFALFPHMTALGNVMAAMGHVEPAERPQRAHRLLDLVHLAGLENRFPQALSGGEQQRVALARALAREPRVLLLDEPFSAVDRAARERLYEEVASLRRVLNMPVVLVTHDLDEALRLADRLAVLEGGRILQTGAPFDVLSRPVSQAAARIIGLKNIFSSRVTAYDPVSRRVSFAFGGSTLTAQAPAPFVPNSPCAWSLASGRVQLSAVGSCGNGSSVDGAPEAHLQAIVEDCHRTQAGTEVTALLEDGERLHASLRLGDAARADLQLGSRIALAVPEADIHVFAPEGAR